MTTNESNDIALLVSVLEAEEPHIKAIYKRRLESIAARWGVDDLFGEVAYRAVRDWDKCLSREPEGVRRWLRVTAHNATMSALDVHVGREKRSVRREVSGSSEGIFHQLEDAATHRDANTTEVDELLHMVIAAVDELPSRQTHAIRRSYLDGADYAEIADEMNVSQCAVRSLAGSPLADRSPSTGIRGPDGAQGVA